jgi:hypothetical protein
VFLRHSMLTSKTDHILFMLKDVMVLSDDCIILKMVHLRKIFMCIATTRDENIPLCIIINTLEFKCVYIYAYLVDLTSLFNYM